MPDFPVPEAAVEAVRRARVAVDPGDEEAYARAVLTAAAPHIVAAAYRQAAASVLDTGSHEDTCDLGPRGTCGCLLGEHYRLLIRMADEAGTRDD